MRQKSAGGGGSMIAGTQHYTSSFVVMDNGASETFNAGKLAIMQ